MTRGYLTFVQNSETTDYLRCAYLQALSIKVTNKINKYAIVVDDYTKSLLTDRHRRVFDYIIPMPLGDDAQGEKWKMSNEWKAYIASPFDETIKLESDMLFTANIDHWWDILSAKDVCFTTKVASYTEQVSTTRVYREVFDTNQLPDIYAGFYYFKKTEVSKELFDLVKTIFDNWDQVRSRILKNALGQPRNTDLAFALATKLLDAENFYLPGNVPMFTHMKGAVQGWAPESVWTDLMHYQLDRSTVTVGFQRQRLPFHYHFKDFPKPEVVKHYERLYNEQT